MNQEQRSFIIEGNIGAGKSTFLSLLEELPLQLVYEPHEQWQSVGQGGNLLEAFYTDTKRWAYTFQSYAFITRIMTQQEHALRNIHEVQVLERSVYSDRYCFAKNCFEMGTMSTLEWQLYTEWFEWLVERYTVRPAGFIYLRTSPKVCYERLAKRARSEEAAVPLSYLQSLHDKHEAWLIKKDGIANYLKTVPVLILDCDSEFATDHQKMEEHRKAIQNFIYGDDMILPSKKTVSVSL